MYPKHYYLALTNLHFITTSMILASYIPTNPSNHVSLSLTNNSMLQLCCVFGNQIW